MLRFTTVTALALALGLSLPALAAEKAIEGKAPQAAVVAAATEDAVPLPLPATQATDQDGQTATKRVVPHGSSQSAGGYRFTTPYAVPPQTLPMGIPSLSVFHF
jgi:hypothetical protein